MNRSRVLAVLRIVLAVLVVGGVTFAIATNWAEVSADLRRMSPGVIALAALIGCIPPVLTVLVWRRLLADLGSPIHLAPAGGIFFVGQLGKYVPGSVVAFLMQMELAKAVGVNRARSFTASLLAAGLAVVASLIAGMCALPAFFRGNHELLWLFLLLPIGLAFLHPKLLTWLVSRVLRLLRRAPLPYPISVGAIVKGVVVSLGIYVALGVHMYLLISSLGHHGFGALVLCVGAMGLAMTAGLVAFFLPSGIGARELVIVTALVTVMPYGQALALAVVSRLMFTVGDLASAGGAALFAQLRRRQAAVADSAPVGA